MTDNRMTIKELRELQKNGPYYLNTKEMMRLYGCSHVTIQRMREHGELPYVKVGKNYRYPLDEVLALVRAAEIYGDYEYDYKEDIWI